jgi:hypothetical protein
VGDLLTGLEVMKERMALEAGEDPVSIDESD